MVGRDGCDLARKYASHHFLAHELPWPGFGDLGCLAGMTCLTASHHELQLGREGVGPLVHTSAKHHKTMFEDVPRCFGGQPWRHIAPGMAYPNLGAP